MTVVSIVLLLGLAVMLLLPLFRSGFPITDDGDWMVIRLSAFYQSFREGQFPVRFLGRLYHGYGYPVSNFLYPGFLYIGSVLHMFGIPFTVSVKLIIICSVIVGSLATYGWLRKFFYPGASFLGAASFLLMPYLMYDIFTRGSVGEVLAICCMMICLYAFDGKHRWIFPFAVAFLAMSHNTLALFFLPILFLYICIRRSWDYLLLFAYGLGMTAFFWIPVLFEQSLVQFNKTIIADSLQYISVSQQLMLQSLPVFIAACVCIFLGKKKTHISGQTFFFITMTVGLFFTTVISTIFWRFNLLSTFVQFPYRFLAVWCVFGPWFIGNIADRFSKKISIFLVVGSLVVLAFFAFGEVRNTRSIRPEGFYTTNEDTTTTHNEYLPLWATKQETEHTDTKLVFISGDGKIEEKHMSSNEIDAVLHTREPSILQVNTIFYPGWGAMIDDHQIRISYDNPYGLMQLLIPSGTHHLYMAFRETAGRFMADVMSLLSFIITAITLIYYTHREKSIVKKTKKRNV